MIEAGSTLFAGCADWQPHTEEAKKYIEKYALTSEDVKLVKRGEQLLIITKRNIELKEPEQHEIPF